MSRKKKELPAMPAIEVSPELLEQLVPAPMNPQQFESLFRGLKNAIVERALGEELTHHMGYSKGDAPPPEQANCRNGTTPKAVLTDDGTPLSPDFDYTTLSAITRVNGRLSKYQRPSP